MTTITTSYQLDPIESSYLIEEEPITIMTVEEDAEIDAAIHAAFDRLNLQFAELSRKTQSEVTETYRKEFELLKQAEQAAAQKTTGVVAKSKCSCCIIS